MKSNAKGSCTKSDSLFESFQIEIIVTIPTMIMVVKEEKIMFREMLSSFFAKSLKTTVANSAMIKVAGSI